MLWEWRPDDGRAMGGRSYHAPALPGQDHPQRTHGAARLHRRTVPLRRRRQRYAHDTTHTAHTPHSPVCVAYDSRHDPGVVCVVSLSSLKSEFMTLKKELQQLEDALPKFSPGKPEDKY